MLPRGGPDPQTSVLKDFVTQWGADPVWRSGPITTVAPSPARFPLRVRGAPVPYAVPDLDPGEEGTDLPPGPYTVGPYRPHDAPVEVAVDLAPHAVGYDPDRRLWYADIVINPGDTYFPFIRLALARYQPQAVTGAHLSSVVLAEFVQLTPDRLLIVSDAPSADRRVRRVAVHGVTPEAAPQSPRAGEIRLELQTLVPGADETLGWSTVEQGRPLAAGPGQLVRRSPLARGMFHLGRERLDERQRALLVEAEALLAANDFGAITARPELLELLKPPLIHEEDIILPARAEGARLRLLVTESETYHSGEFDPRGAPRTVSRIIYAETVEL